MKRTENPQINKKALGFSLIELIIVVVILGIIAAVAIPNLLAARRLANESSAVATIRTIVSAQTTYKLSYTGLNFATFSELQTVGLIDNTIGGSPLTKSGYRLELDVFTAPARFDLRARPVMHQLTSPITGTGSKDFGVNETGIIYRTEDNTPVNFDAATRQVQGTSAVPIG